MSLTNEEIREFTLMALDQPRTFPAPKIDFTQTGTWWVDYRGWIYDRSGSKLRVRDGLTGEVLDMTEPCLGRNDGAAIKVYDNVLGYCVVRETSEDKYQTWRFRFYDGSVAEIKLPFIAVSSGIYFTDYYEPFWGYANGILAISHSGKNGQNVWTYSKEGELLFKTVAVSGVRWACIEAVYPLSWNTVGVIKSGSDFHENYYWDSYSILSDTAVHPGDNKPLFARYYPAFPSGVYANKQVTKLGEDDVYFYAAAKMYNSSGSATGEWVIARFNKFNYSGPEELAKYNGTRTWKNVSESKMISYQYQKYASENISPSAFQYLHMMDPNDVDVYDPVENPFESGRIDQSSGNNVSSSTRIRTSGYVPVTAGVTYQLTSNIDQAYIHFYNSSKSYLRNKDVGWITLPHSAKVPTGAAFARVVLAKKQEYWRRFINLPTCTKYYGGRFDFFTSSSTYNGAYDNATHIWIDQNGVFRK